MSLHSLEKNLSVLWTDEKARSAYLKNGQLPEDSEFKGQFDERGLRTYAELISIGRNDLMLSVYPGCARLLNKKWPETVEAYFQHCPSEHYRLNMAAGEFSRYLKEARQDHLKKFPYLSCLADYEWIELQLMEDARQIVPQEHIPLAEPAQFETWAPIVNPVLCIRNYDYPVPVIVDYLREGQLPRNITPREVTVAVYRDPKSHLGRYVEVSNGMAKVITQAQEQPTSYADLASLAISYSKAESPQAALVEFLEAIEKLQSLQIFIGSQVI